MAPPHSRHLLAWTLPTAVVLLSYLWYKRKRIGARSDPGDNKSPTHKEEVFTDKSLEEELKEADEHDSSQSSPSKSFSRSLSGVESTPIDIIIPPELRATKSTPRIVSDEDLDFEIEKIKSMKNGSLFPAKLDSPIPNKSKSSTYRDNKESKPKSKKNQKKEAGKMAQKDIAIVEEKLTSLKISKNKETPKKREHKNSTSKKDSEELQRQNSERDSANHSPSDVMLASPSLSSISDNHSEGSSDSGKGGSDVATPPASRTPGIDVSSNVRTLYEFVIPQSLVGKLIGRHGCFVTQIKDKTNALIIVRAHPTNNKMKLCLVEGTRTEIDSALKMVRDKFPAKRYPEITLEEVHLVPEVPTVSLISDHLYLKLVEGVNNDTVLSCLVAPNHLFLQQPTHPSYPSLNLLTNCMNGCYSQSESPLLPSPIPENTICAAYSVHAWYRAMVLSSDAESSYVKFLDYGGFAYVDNSQLRQIRGDFMLLPFQAAECMLANIKSVNEDGSWPEEAYNLVADLAKGSIMYTQVADYTEDGLPLVLIYAVIGSQCSITPFVDADQNVTFWLYTIQDYTGVVFLNQHLVDNGFAEWLQEGDTQTHRQEIAEGAVGGVSA